MKNVWPLVPLSEVLTQYKKYINFTEPRLYRKLSVKLYGKGVVLDIPVNGSSVRMKRHQIARAGQVVLSEIWGKKGAIGFVPQDGDGALFTSHFFLFDVIDEKAYPAYLQLIFRSNYLQDQLDAEAKGTTGYAAVRPSHFLSERIPLPPLQEQHRIADNIDRVSAKIDAAKSIREKAQRETEALMTAILKHLLRVRDHWQVKPISDCSFMKTGTTPPTQRQDY